MSDHLQKFLFDHHAVRGEHTQLVKSYQDILRGHHYPQPIQKLIGEFVAAATLLSSTLKFDGVLTVQAQGEGPLRVIMAECRHNQEVRAIARFDNIDDKSEADLIALLGQGHLAITIDPDQGQRYQGIVPLDGNNLGQCLEHYFEQSEQLDTRIWLAANNQPNQEMAAGFMLQAIPENSGPTEQSESWQHLTALSDTLSNEEILTLDSETLLYRLFHEEDVRVLEAKTVNFSCSCSEQRMIQAVQSLDKQELRQLFSEQKTLTVNCEFCNTHYELTADMVGHNPTLH